MKTILLSAMLLALSLGAHAEDWAYFVNGYHEEFRVQFNPNNGNGFCEGKTIANQCLWQKKVNGVWEDYKKEAEIGLEGEEGNCNLTNLHGDAAYACWEVKCKLANLNNAARNACSHLEEARLGWKRQAEADAQRAEWDAGIAAARKARAELAKKPGAAIGMTQQQVREETGWGIPQSINRTTTAAGTDEQWVYRDYQYLYFSNGVLTAIQN